MFLAVFVAVFSVLLSIQTEEINAQTPPPPSTGNLGGSKADQIALFESYLNSASPEQTAVFTDQNPLLKLIVKVFNSTLLTQVQGYAVHKSMLSSDNEECNAKAKKIADDIMSKACDDTIVCLTEFRRKIRTEVMTTETDIRELPGKLRAELILPVDECFEEQKISTMKKFGQNTVDHWLCLKKI